MGPKKKSTTSPYVAKRIRELAPKYGWDPEEVERRIALVAEGVPLEDILAGRSKPSEPPKPS